MARFPGKKVVGDVEGPSKTPTQMKTNKRGKVHKKPAPAKKMSNRFKLAVKSEGNTEEMAPDTHSSDEGVPENGESPVKMEKSGPKRNSSQKNRSDHRPDPSLNFLNVNNIPDLTLNEMRPYFETFGPVVECHKFTQIHVTMKTVQSAAKAIAALDKHGADGPLGTSKIKLPRLNKDRPQKDPTTTVHVDMKPTSLTFRKLKSFFSDSGDIVKIYVLGKTADIVFRDENAVELALEKNGHNFESVDVSVRRWRPEDL